MNRKVVTVPQQLIERAEDILERHLASYGPEGAAGGGLRLIGGGKWWRVRGRELEGEWIEVCSTAHVCMATDGADAKGLSQTHGNAS